MNNKQPFRPLFFIEPNAMSKRDIRRAEKSGITIVECSNPASIRQCQPEPISILEQKAKAALEFVRWAVLHPQGLIWNRSDIAKNFVEFLMRSEKPAEVQQPKQVKSV